MDIMVNVGHRRGGGKVKGDHFVSSGLFDVGDDAGDGRDCSTKHGNPKKPQTTAITI